jgi:hypothetical protein
VDSRCAIVSVVRSSAILRSSAWIAFSDFESSADVASSKIRIRGSFENGAGDRDALLLPARKLEPALADRGRVALGRALDERVDLRELRRARRSPRASRLAARTRCCIRCCR